MGERPEGGVLRNYADQRGEFHRRGRLGGAGWRGKESEEV